MQCIDIKDVEVLVYDIKLVESFGLKVILGSLSSVKE